MHSFFFKLIIAEMFRSKKKALRRILLLTTLLSILQVTFIFQLMNTDYYDSIVEKNQSNLLFIDVEFLREDTEFVMKMIKEIQRIEFFEIDKDEELVYGRIKVMRLEEVEKVLEILQKSNRIDSFYSYENIPTLEKLQGLIGHIRSFTTVLIVSVIIVYIFLQLYDLKKSISNYRLLCTLGYSSSKLLVKQSVETGLITLISAVAALLIGKIGYAVLQIRREFPWNIENDYKYATIIFLIQFIVMLACIVFDLSFLRKGLQLEE